MTLRFQASALLAPASGDLRGTAQAQAARTRSGAMASALLAEGAAVPNVPALLEGGALAVTTGQQAGLFTGPLYAVYKALSAAALALEMSEAGMGVVVPVFWVAGDDHDFSEINHAFVLGQDGRPVRITLRERAADAPMLPAYREPAGLEANQALQRLEEALPPGDARTETTAWLARGYTPPAGMVEEGLELSVAEGHARAMAELLGPYGIVIARGWSPELKRAAADVFTAAATRAAEIDAALAAHALGMKARGAAIPVDVGEGMSLLMLEGGQGRDRLKIAPGGFVTRRGNTTVSLDEVKRIIASEPGRISANVLLRPVVEAAVFPTVGYFGGPGELGYLEQTAPLFQVLGVPRPARLPRLSGFLVEAKVDKVLEKYRLTLADLSQDESTLAARIAREGLPESTSKALEALRAAITEQYAAVQAEVALIDKTLEKPAENARNQALMGTREIEKKLVAALKRTFDTAIQQVARARDQVYPEGQPQERVISIVSFLGRHGRPVLDLVFAAARDHARRLLEAAPVRT